MRGAQVRTVSVSYTHLMLDMGDTVEDIAEKSGFSATTVRRRVKLLELDKDKFKKSEERGCLLYTSEHFPHLVGVLENLTVVHMCIRDRQCAVPHEDVGAAKR